MDEAAPGWLTDHSPDPLLSVDQRARLHWRRQARRTAAANETGSIGFGMTSTAENLPRLTSQRNILSTSADGPGVQPWAIVIFGDPRSERLPASQCLSPESADREPESRFYGFAWRRQVPDAADISPKRACSIVGRV